MRFLNIQEEKKNPIKENVGKTARFLESEVFHLKAIELVCRYIPSPCPYVNHLISSFNKHYGQSLETI